MKVYGTMICTSSQKYQYGSDHFIDLEYVLSSWDSEYVLKATDYEGETFFSKTYHSKNKPQILNQNFISSFDPHLLNKEIIFSAKKEKKEITYNLLVIINEQEQTIIPMTTKLSEKWKTEAQYTPSKKAGALLCREKNTLYVIGDNENYVLGTNERIQRDMHEHQFPSLTLLNLYMNQKNYHAIITAKNEKGQLIMLVSGESLTGHRKFTETLLPAEISKIITFHTTKNRIYISCKKGDDEEVMVYENNKNGFSLISERTQLPIKHYPSSMLLKAKHSLMQLPEKLHDIDKRLQEVTLAR